jgi:hypothetical protein
MIKKMSKEEEKTYKEENELKKPKFTDREGQSRALYSCGWSKEGLNFYYDMLAKWKLVGGNKEAWEELEVYWQIYTEETGFDNQWKKRSPRCRAKTPLVPPLEEEPLRARFSLPGTEGFDDVFSWKKNPRRVSADNDPATARSSSKNSDESSSQMDEGDNEDEDDSALYESEDEENLEGPSPPTKKRKKRTKLNEFASPLSGEYDSDEE